MGVLAGLNFQNLRGEMGDAQKSALASFDRCREPPGASPLLYGLAVK